MKTTLILLMLFSVNAFSQSGDSSKPKAKSENSCIQNADSLNINAVKDKQNQIKISSAWQTDFNMRNYPKNSMECSVTLGSWKVKNAIMTLVNDTTVCVTTKSKKNEFNGISFYVYEETKNFFRNIDDISGVKTNNMSKTTGGIYGALGGIIVGELIGIALKKDESDSTFRGIGGIIGGLLGYFVGSQLTPGEKYYDFKKLNREKRLKKLRAILKENYIDAD